MFSPFIYLYIFAFILLLMLIITLILFIRNRRTRKLYNEQMLVLDAIYKSLPDYVYSKDINGYYKSCNQSFEKFTGRKEADIIGKTPFDVYEDQKKARDFAEVDIKVFKEDAIIKEERWFTFSDNSRKLFETIKVPLRSGGKVTGMLGIGRDITEHKIAEEAAHQASRAKSDFLAKMSHEIRTPMNAIIGMAELALRSDEINAIREHVITVKQAGVNLLSLINDILDFSKIETGKFEIIPGDYSFASLINDVINIIRMKVIDSKIRFAVKIDSKIPNSLVGDEIRIRQVLLNILGNAVKYTDKGYVSFAVNSEFLADDTINLIMDVKDTGKGIKQEDLTNLFGEYIQFDPEKNKGIEGTGLGLAIARNIVKAMDGDISAVSEYGKGSTFTIKLPQQIRSRGSLAVVENPEEKHVLVFERREIYSDAIVFSVENLNVKCTLASSDSDFQEKLKSRDFTFIFISFGLYDKNREILSNIGVNTKIVLLTEFGEAIPDKNLNILAMPVHSVSIANIINGISDNFSYSERNEVIVSFTAPQANILVVDDIITNLKVAKGLLTPYKAQVDLCKSGIIAINAIETNHYDIVFMDHKMPEMDGIETTRRIRAMGNEEPYYKNVPIIALTANAVSGTKEMFMENGFNDFLSKPIDTIKLNSVLEKWIPKEKQKGSIK